MVLVDEAIAGDACPNSQVNSQVVGKRSVELSFAKHALT